MTFLSCMCGNKPTGSSVPDGREHVTLTTPCLCYSDMKYNPRPVCPKLPHDEMEILEPKGNWPLIGLDRATVALCSPDRPNCGLGLSRWRRRRRRKWYFWKFSTALMKLHGHFTGRFTTCECLLCSSFLNMWYVGREKCWRLPQSRQQTAWMAPGKYSIVQQDDRVAEPVGLKPDHTFKDVVATLASIIRHIRSSAAIFIIISWI